MTAASGNQMVWWQEDVTGGVTGASGGSKPGHRAAGLEIVKAARAHLKTDLEIGDGVVHLLLLFVGSLRIFIGRLPAGVQILFGGIQLCFSLLQLLASLASLNFEPIQLLLQQSQQIVGSDLEQLTNTM